jgi:phosphoribosylformylglycinamidine synthase
MWQFATAVNGLADGCQVLGTPVTGGNVSFYNQTGDVPIHPTPVIGVLGVIRDVSLRLTSGFAADGDPIVLLGDTRLELGGSAWAHLVHGHTGGRPPVPDLAAEQRLAALAAEAAESGLLASAHDLSDGGLAVALAESCLRGGRGCTVTLPGDAFTYLFSESAARAIVSCAPDALNAVLALAARHGVPAEAIGRVGGDSLTVDGATATTAGQEGAAGEFTIELAELAGVHGRALPEIFG